MMQTKPPLLLSTFILFFQLNSNAQLFGGRDDSKAGWVSFGARSTISSFDHDGSGIGAGGQYRIQLSNSVSTDWYADYITINVGNKVRSEYYHIGWSVLFYPFSQLRGATMFQPYVLAGHCFDYNKKTAIGQPAISKSRWGSAVQAGLGINAGHDLNLENLKYLKDNLAQLDEVSIGHALICDAVYLGLENTIRLYLNKLV